MQHRQFMNNMSSTEAGALVLQYRNKFQEEKFSLEKHDVLEVLLKYVSEASNRWFYKAPQQRFDIVSYLLQHAQLPDVYFFQLVLRELGNVQDDENSSLKKNLWNKTIGYRNKYLQPIEEVYKPSSLLMNTSIWLLLLLPAINFTYTRIVNTNQRTGLYSETNSSFDFRVSITGLLATLSFLYLLTGCCRSYSAHERAVEAVRNNLEEELKKLDNQKAPLKCLTP